MMDNPLSGRTVLSAGRLSIRRDLAGSNRTVVRSPLSVLELVVASVVWVVLIPQTLIEGFPNGMSAYDSGKIFNERVEGVPQCPGSSEDVELLEEDIVAPSLSKYFLCRPE